MLRNATLTLLLALFAVPMAMAQSAPTCAETGTNEGRESCVLTDASINAGQTIQLDGTKTYILRGVVVVEDGAKLFAPAGTIFKAERVQGGDGTTAAALLVARGGQLFAEGTAADPVIFTSIDDNLDSADLLTYQSRGLWGGVILLGTAKNNRSEGERDIEGINQILTGDDTRDVYGCLDTPASPCNDQDNSGVLRYVSIRHSGVNVGSSDGNEIQGLTLGSVGSGTTIEYVESYASADDGFEFFGGTVDTKYLVSAFNADDSFDWDQGFRGRGQFWFAVQGSDAAGALAEQDGASGSQVTNQPFAIPVIYNATLIGPGVGNTPLATTDRGAALYFRENSGGKYFNSIITEFETADGGFALRIRDDLEPDAYDRFVAGDLELGNNIWWDFGNDSAPTSDLASLVRSDNDAAKNAIVAGLASGGNTLVDPMLGGIDRSAIGSGGIDPLPQFGSPAYNQARRSYDVSNDDGFFVDVGYTGAFGRTNWLLGWTALSDNGYTTVATDIETVNETAPKALALVAYPNPFAGETTVQFDVDRAQHIRLAVYDLMGRQVALLADEMTPAGTFSATFDASGLSAGTYVIRMQGESAGATRMTTLLR